MKLIKDKRTGKEIDDVLPASLTNDMDISAGAKLLWIKFWNSNNSKTKTYKEWKPTTKTLASQFDVDESTIKRWIKELKNTGWISKIGSRNTTNMLIHFTPMLVSPMPPVPWELTILLDLPTG